MADLKRRLKELSKAAKPMSKDWAAAVAEQSGRNAPRGKTGKLAQSFNVRSATGKRAIIDAIWYAKFPNKGTQAHVIKAKGKSRGLIFRDGGNTIFTKKVKHPGTRGTGFVFRAAHEGLRKHINKQALIDAWNRGA